MYGIYLFLFIYSFICLFTYIWVTLFGQMLVNRHRGADGMETARRHAHDSLGEAMRIHDIR